MGSPKLNNAGRPDLDRYLRLPLPVGPEEDPENQFPQLPGASERYRSIIEMPERLTAQIARPHRACNPWIAKDVVTRFTLLISAGSIDDSVDGRLAEKVSALSLLMDDPGLVQIALPSADEGSGGTPAFDDDYQAIAAHFASGNA
ncbi:MAG: hypothetical protein QGI70_00375 [Paracoccaceae bacterium]|nr:hypothetical protein [Paracoccaceae bacterium]